MCKGHDGLHNVECTSKSLQHSVEISSALAEMQKQTVGEVHSHLSKFKVERQDAMDRSGWDADQQPCWVIMLEMWDEFNGRLPTPVSAFCREGLSELYKPLQDSLIRCCVEILELDKNNTRQNSSVSKA